MSNNEGVWLDESGEADDYIELVNVAKEPVDLSKYSLFDEHDGQPLASLSLEPGGTVLLWADASPEQGERHLPFKVAAKGERLRLLSAEGLVVDEVSVPELAEHHAYSRIPDGSGAFVDCGWATPGRSNGDRCGPAAPALADPQQDFAPYVWPSPWPAPSRPLRISEARLLPTDFVEIENTSSTPVDLSQFELRIAGTNPRLAWPTANEGNLVQWPQATLAAGELLSVKIDDDALGEVAQTPNFEGVISVFDTKVQRLIDRLEFSDWPQGATLARSPDASAPFRFCNEATPGLPNLDCDPLSSRPVGKYLHDLQTPGDFHALSSGHSTLGEESIEFLIDLEAGDTVVFLNSNVFATHYNYVREILNQEGPIDLCTPAGRTAYHRAWATFVDDNFIRTDGRRYQLGSLVKHAGSDLSTITFSPVNRITAEQLKHVFFTLAQHLPDPAAWAVRPIDPDQAERFRAAEGEVPLVAVDAPYRGVTFQPMVPGVTFGTLQVVATGALDSRALGPRDIVLTDSIPNDIPLIAGIITETFQTPLSHVNVLSRARGTPNMGLLDARHDPRVEPFLGQLVRLEVSGFSFAISKADPAEALDFWETHRPTREPLVPRLEVGVRGVVPLADRSFSDLPSIGGKAAQMAELAQVELCGSASIPDQPFALPVVHSLEHYEASGARALLDELSGDPAFLADPSVRARGLAQVRDRVLSHPVDRDLHEAVVNAIAQRWPGGRVRFRSSSNVEDLAGFNGAGLYVSEGVDLEGSKSDIDDAIRQVWASLWNDRAFAEREYYNVDQSQVAMAVLVHPGFPSERANGVVVSRNVLDPARFDELYVNAQVGEALVTNPAPGILADEFVYDPTVPQSVFYQHSTFSPDQSILTEEEQELLSCNAFAIHRHFAPVLDPDQQNPWFAMDMEFKLIGPKRELLIKQARAYSFGQELPPGWCDL